MAITITLVEAGNNRLRYLLSAPGAGADTGVITSTGAATPDVRTDAKAGPIKALALAAVNGFATIAAGALTQAQARALWQSELPIAAGIGTMPGNPGPQTAICQITQRIAGAGAWAVDVNVTGGNPVINIASQGAISTAYLDIFVPGAEGV